MIVKVQLSAFTTAAEQLVLIYNKARSFEVELPLSACPGLLEVMGKDMPKAFFEVSLINGILHVHDRVPDEKW